MERLVKLLARAGVASRRAAAELLAQGRVTVDGAAVTDCAAQVDPQRSLVRVDGRILRLPSAATYLLLDKPAGYLSARRDDFGRATVMDLIPEPLRATLYPVGRLDLDSTGLLLLSDDGELTYRLLHPSHHVPKTYRVRVSGVPSDQSLRRLRSGVELGDGVTAPAEVWLRETGRGEATLEITLREGRNRQVRRMCQAVGHPVTELQRVALGPLTLGDLPPGQWRPLTEGEVRALRQAVGLEEGQARD